MNNLEEPIPKVEVIKVPKGLKKRLTKLAHPIVKPKVKRILSDSQKANLKRG